VQQLINAMRGVAAAQVGSIGQPRFGTVTSVDPTNHTAKVMLHPDEILTGWLPVMSSFAGNGWGISCAPSPGNQVMVLPQDGDGEHGVIAGVVYSDQHRPPGGASGELWITHASGSRIKLTNDGKVSIHDAAGNGADFTNDGTVSLTGQVKMNNNVSINGTLSVTGAILVNGVRVIVP
jgi:phage baseplate assembly protein V